MHIKGMKGYFTACKHTIYLAVWTKREIFNENETNCLLSSPGVYVDPDNESTLPRGDLWEFA